MLLFELGLKILGAEGRTLVGRGSSTYESLEVGKNCFLHLPLKLALYSHFPDVFPLQPGIRSGKVPRHLLEKPAYALVVFLTPQSPSFSQ